MHLLFFVCAGKGIFIVYFIKFHSDTFFREQNISLFKVWPPLLFFWSYGILCKKVISFNPRHSLRNSWGNKLSVKSFQRAILKSKLNKYFIEKLALRSAACIVWYCKLDISKQLMVHASCYCKLDVCYLVRASHYWKNFIQPYW